MGNFHLKPEIPQSNATTMLLQEEVDPTCIVEQLKQAAATMTTASEPQRTNCTYPFATTSATDSSSQSTMTTSSQLSNSTSPHPTTSNVKSDTLPGDNVLASIASIAERAATVISTGKISLDPKLSVFLINGTTDSRIVRLFPAETCSCPSTSTCYHIAAARMAVGLHVESSRRKSMNLTQLRKNKRKRADKKSGRKAPRHDDVDMVAAGDAEPSETTRLQSIIIGSERPQPDPSEPIITIHVDNSQTEKNRNRNIFDIMMM